MTTRTTEPTSGTVPNTTPAAPTSEYIDRAEELIATLDLHGVPDFLALAQVYATFAHAEAINNQTAIITEWADALCTRLDRIADANAEVTG